MSDQPGFDVMAAHRYFAVQCYNDAFALIDKRDRSAADDARMLHLGMASLWHWTQRPDCTATNLSIGYWQVARIYALLGQPDDARRYGFRCLEVSQTEGVEPFYAGFAYEALARAEAVANDSAKRDEYLREAYAISERITDDEEKQMLLSDLRTIL
jgi:hypothetical protein